MTSFKNKKPVAISITFHFPIRWRWPAEGRLIHGESSLERCGRGLIPFLWGRYELIIRENEAPEGRFPAIKADCPCMEEYRRSRVFWYSDLCVSPIPETRKPGGGAQRAVDDEFFFFSFLLGVESCPEEKERRRRRFNRAERSARIIALPLLFLFFFRLA